MVAVHLGGIGVSEERRVRKKRTPRDGKNVLAGEAFKGGGGFE